MSKSKKKKAPKQKRKRTAAEKQARRERRKNTMIIFLNGKQKRVPRPPTIEGLPVDEFIRRNADPIWLHQNEMWEYIKDDSGDAPDTTLPLRNKGYSTNDRQIIIADDEELPF